MIVAQAREDLNLAATITYPVAASFVGAYEQRGTHAVLIFPAGRVASDPRVNPPIPAALRSLVRQGQLGYQRMDVAGHPYLVLAARIPQSAGEAYLFFSERDIGHYLAQLRTILAGAWLGVLLVAALIGRVLARRTLEPVARASEAARLIADGQLGTRLQAGGADECDREPHNLDVRREVALPEQLGAHLEHLARAAAALGLLPVHGPRVGEPKRPVGAGEGGGGHARQAGGEVVTHRQNATISIRESHQPLGDSGSAGAEEGVFILERRRDQLLVAGPLERAHRRALQAAPAADRFAGQVECAGRNRGDG